MLSAELAYLFRHGLVRDGAYQLQTPSDRAKLHELAFYLIEANNGGRAPEAPALDAIDSAEFDFHQTDTVAAELAEHAQLALAGSEQQSDEFVDLQKLYLRRAAEYAERQYQVADSARLWLMLAPLLPTLGCEALRRAGIVLAKNGYFAKAEELFEQALLSARTTGNMRIEASSLGNKASVCQHTGRMKLAEKIHEQALIIHRRIGNADAEAGTFVNLATIYQNTDRVELAEKTIAQALTIFRRIGNRSAEGILLGNLATVYHDRQQEKLAEETYERALAIQTELGDSYSIGHILGNIASLYNQTGRAGLAELTYNKALENSRKSGNRHSEASVLTNLALFYGDTGRATLVERALEQALTIYKDIGDKLFEGKILISLCCFLVSERRESEALLIWKRGANILLGLNDMPELKIRTRYMLDACVEAGIKPFDVPEF